MHAFNDVLRGGFGKFDYEEPIKIIWKNSGKSKKDLGYSETIEYIRKDRLETFPPFLGIVKENKEKDLQKAKSKQGDTLFQIILKIIQEHKHIELVLQ